MQNVRDLGRRWRTDGEPPAQTMIDADSKTHQHPTYAIMRIIKTTKSGHRGVPRKTRFSGTEATRMTTTWGDSAARGKHVTMRHQSLACMERAKKAEIVARPRSAHIRSRVRHHRSAQRQYIAPSRPPRRRSRPQRRPRARTALWGRPPLRGARLRRSCVLTACLAHPSEHGRAPAPHAYPTPQRGSRATGAAARPTRAVRRARSPCARRLAHLAAQERTGGSPPSARRPHCTRATTTLPHRRSAERANCRPRRGRRPPLQLLRLTACHRCARVQSMWVRTQQGL